MSGPSFSVVVPTYNRAELVMRTLDSVFAQSYPATEVIVVDNASTDRTAEALAPLARTGQIVFFQHPRNLERAASRNTGMDRATADFVTLLDSDDLMLPHALEAAAAYAEENPDRRLFHAAYELVDTAGRHLHTYRLPSLKDPLGAIADGNFMSCIGNFMHRDIYEHYRFNTAPLLSGSEDWEFWLRVVADHSPGRIRHTHFAIVQHPGQTLAQPDVDAARQRLDLILRRMRDDPRLAHSYAPYRQRLETGCLLFLAYLANTTDDHERALAFLKQARHLRPTVVMTRRYCRAFQVAVTGRIRALI